MTVTVKIPTALRRFVAGAEEIRANGNTVGQVVDDINRQFPGFKEKLCGDQDRPQRFVKFYVNGDDIRFLKNFETEVAAGDVVLIIPAIAGGY